MNVTVLGAGGWGLALALLLNDNRNDVTIWCFDEKEKEEILLHRENKRCFPGVKIPIEIYITSDMSEALAEAKIVVVAVPSFAVRSTAQNIAAYLLEDAVVVNVAKGLEPDTLRRFSEVIAEEIANDVVVLSGPSHAEEVARHMPTAVVVSSTNLEAARVVQVVFTAPYFRVYLNEDIVGVELGGALKNIIALAAGAIEGLGYGDNTKAALMTRGIAEISRLSVAMGAQINTLNGLAGIGDLIVTCTSGHSRNRRAGELIAQGFSLDETIKKVNMVVEGIPATKAAYQLSKKCGVEMPITEAIYRSLFEDASVRKEIKKLMCRDSKMEE
ncbi:NAD(P)H-dependent glycerol-3-phosphate dehydrogenase [Candidatus Epulonipiscium viviparus]|uniref:NAD(P)H-dependent glycerol-3-phosphate dehydrogenase n=1 Tax=Candidatus Epulonipiscium viviparus TaxID=420336 RepID=UPI00016C01BB|nr:NAD(P)H-dependent glycerol-3-phosphate dehydrogenase [Candidatus Epulopiscium viviparus]